MLDTISQFRIAAPFLFLAWSHNPSEAIKSAIQDVIFALKYTVIDLEQLKGLERVFSVTRADLQRQPFMPPHRREALAWKEVKKEETYQRILIQLPMYTPVAEDEYESEAPDPKVRMSV